MTESIKKNKKTFWLTLAAVVVFTMVVFWDVARAEDEPAFTLVFDGTEYTPSTFYSTQYNVKPGGSVSISYELKGPDKDKVSIYLHDRSYVDENDKSVASLKNGKFTVTNINYKTDYEIVAKDDSGNQIYLDIFISCSTLKLSVSGLGKFLNGMIYVPEGQSTNIKIDVSSDDMNGICYYGGYYYPDFNYTSISKKNVSTDGKVSESTVKIDKLYTYTLHFEDKHGNDVETTIKFDSFIANPMPNDKLYDSYIGYGMKLGPGEKETIGIVAGPEGVKYSVKWYKDGVFMNETGDSVQITGDGSNNTTYYKADVTETSSGKTVTIWFDVMNTLTASNTEEYELSLEVYDDKKEPGITVNGIEDGGKYSGDVEFSVSSADTCWVFISNDDGESYERLEATKSGNEYKFSFEMDAAIKVAVVKAGDFNLDGKVDSADALQILRYDVGKLTDVNILQILAGNVGGNDQLINSADALQVLRYDVGKTSFGW